MSDNKKSSMIIYKNKNHERNESPIKKDSKTPSYKIKVEEKKEEDLEINFKKTPKKTLIQPNQSGQKQNGAVSKIKENYDTILDESFDEEFFNLMNDETPTEHNAKKTLSINKKILKSNYVSNFKLEKSDKEPAKEEKRVKFIVKENFNVQEENNNNITILENSVSDNKLNISTSEKVTGMLDLSPSTNPIIRVFDDLMNDPSNQFQEKFDHIRLKIITFGRTNTISEEIGDLLFRLGVKHLTEKINDHTGALECFENALKIYNQLDTIIRKRSVLGNPNGNVYITLRNAETLKKICECNIIEGDFNNALNNIDLSTKYFLIAYGDKSIEVAECYFKRGTVLQYQEKWNESEECYRVAMASYKSIFGYLNSSNPDSAISHAEIGDCYFKIGMLNEKYKSWKKSEEFYLTAMEIYKNANGDENNENCANTLFNLGVVAEAAGNKEKAMNYYIESKNILKQIKPNDQDYVDILIKVGNLLHTFDRVEESMENLEEAFNLLKTVHQCDNFEELLPKLSKEQSEDDISSMQKIAEIIEISFLLSKIYVKEPLKKYVEGLKTLKVVLCLMPIEKEYFEETFDLLKKYMEMVESKKDKSCDDDISECVTYFATKLETERDPSSVDLNKTQGQALGRSSTMAPVKTESNKENREKEGDVTQIVYTSVPTYSVSIMKIGEIFHYMARLCSKLGLVKHSIDLSIKSITFFERLPQDNTLRLRICDILNNIGIEYNNINMAELSLKYFEKTLELRIKYNGPDDLKTAGAYNNVAIAYDKLRMFKEAIENWKKCMEIRSKLLPADDVKIANSFYNFSLILSKVKEYDQALSSMLKCLEIYDKKVGPTSQFSADACTSVGEYYKNMNQPDKATSYLQRAYDHYKNKFGNANTTTLKAQVLLGICYSQSKQNDKAIILLKPALEALKPTDPNEPISCILLDVWYELGVSYDAANDYILGLQCYEILAKMATGVWSEERMEQVNGRLTNLKMLADAARYKQKK